MDDSACRWKAYEQYTGLTWAAQTEPEHREFGRGDNNEHTGSDHDCYRIRVMTLVIVSF